MSETKKGCYKYCIVPECVSSTVKTPEKVFFCVPMQRDKREKWCKLMKREVIGPKSMKYACEDHFDLENDTENLIKYKLVGGTLRLKIDVYPHKFNCQNKVGNPVRKRRAYEKGRRAEYFKNRLNKDVPSTSSCQPFEVIKCESIPTLNELNVAEDPLPNDRIGKILDDPPKSFKHKGVQVNLKVKRKSKGVQTIARRNRTINAENKSFKFKP